VRGKGGGDKVGGEGGGGGGGGGGGEERGRGGGARSAEKRGIGVHESVHQVEKSSNLKDRVQMEIRKDE